MVQTNQIRSDQIRSDHTRLDTWAARRRRMSIPKPSIHPNPTTSLPPSLPPSKPLSWLNWLPGWLTDPWTSPMSWRRTRPSASRNLETSAMSTDTPGPSSFASRSRKILQTQVQSGQFRFESTIS
jgi:hypothetical protein